MEYLIQTLLSLTSDFGYLGIVILMAIESSVIPLPSEVIIPPAAYLAYKGEMNIFLIILCGVIGTLIGATANYFLGMYLGRPILHRLAKRSWAKYLFLTEESLKKAEDYFLKNGSMSTFVGRLIPGIRHLIPLPAGFVKMNFGAFVIFTALGSGIWVSILVVLGYYWGANDEVLKGYYGEISWGILVAVVLFIGVFIFRKKRKVKVDSASLDG